MSIVVEEDEDDDDIDGLNDSFVSACSDLVSSRDPAGRRRRRGSRSPPPPPSHWSLVGVLVFSAIPLFRFRFRFGSSPLFSPRRKAVATIRFCFLLVLFGFFVWSLVRFSVLSSVFLLFCFGFISACLRCFVMLMLSICVAGTPNGRCRSTVFFHFRFLCFLRFLLCSIVFVFCGIQGAVAPNGRIGPTSDRRRITSFSSVVENELSIKLTQFKTGPTWGRSYC